MREKSILCLDFDGVVHSYEHGWGNGSIYGTVTPGFWEWAIEAARHFRLVIHSSRATTEEGRIAMTRWLSSQEGKYKGDQPLPQIEFAGGFSPAFLTIDDRCVRFDGDWSMLSPTALLAFKPWHDGPDQAEKERMMKERINELNAEILRARAIIEDLKLWRETWLCQPHQTTPKMRARIRELATERDDFDRAVLMLLDDFEAEEALKQAVRQSVSHNAV